MRKSFLSTVFAFTLSFLCRGQIAIPEEIIVGSALVQAGNISSGSGFFIQDTAEIYFITARHVLLDEVTNPQTNIIGYKPKSSEIEIRWYARQAESSNSSLMKINLDTIYKSGNLKFGEGRNDFAIMRIGVIVPKEGFGEIHFSSAVTRIGPGTSLNGYPIFGVRNLKETKIGDDILMVGYPKSLGMKESPQYDFNRPLLRKGIVAGKDPTHGTIIIDCPSFKGNSGGAVFEVERSLAEINYYLVGIVSEFIPYEEVWISENYGIRNSEISNSGYSVIASIETAIDQINVIRKVAFK